MASLYPGALDALTKNKADATVAATDHPAHHNDLADAVNKIEAELGVLPKGTAASVAARLALLQTATAGSINMKGYGAVGNGITNDAAAIQAGFNAVPAGGGMVYFPPGTYRIGAQVNLPTDRPFRVTGDGMFSSIIKAADGLELSPFRYNGTRNSDSSIGAAMDWISFTDIGFDGNKANNAAGSCLELRGADYFVVDRCAFVQGNDHGLYVYQGNDAHVFNSFFHGNCTLSNQTHGQLTLDGAITGSPPVDTHDISVMGCSFENSGGHGVYCKGANESTIQGNNFWDCSNGVRVETVDATDLTIIGNVIEASRNHGISATTGPSYLTISANICKGSVADGIRLTSVLDCVVTGHVCRDNGGTGIVESGTTDRSLIVGNKVRTNTTAQITTIGAGTVSANNGTA